MSNTAVPVLVLDHIKKSFQQGKTPLTIIQDGCLEIQSGEVVALIGPSGSGKSTLLHMAGLLDQPEQGEVVISGKHYVQASDRERTYIRRTQLGFIYQFHHLLPEFSALENVMMPRLIAGVAKNVAREEATAILAKLGLEKRLTHRPSALSGGEQQRVAIARALVSKPLLVLADEPTGNLDPHTALEVMQLFVRTAEQQHTAVFMVTHNHELAAKAHRMLTLQEGKIVELGR